VRGKSFLKGRGLGKEMNLAWTAKGSHFGGAGEQSETGSINLLSALYTVLAVRRFAKLHPETQSMLESLTGEDLNGDGVVAPDVKGFRIMITPSTTLSTGSSRKLFQLE